MKLRTDEKQTIDIFQTRKCVESVKRYEAPRRRPPAVAIMALSTPANTFRRFTLELAPGSGGAEASPDSTVSRCIAVSERMWSDDASGLWAMHFCVRWDFGSLSDTCA